MLNTKTNHTPINIMNLVNVQSTKNKSYDTWLDIRDINNSSKLSEQYSHIFQEHYLDKKWMLMVNPENEALVQLSEIDGVDCSKILKVNANKVNVDINSIGKALQKGNCSVIILCNPYLQDDELLQLSAYAKQGKTQCIVLKNNKTLH